MAKANQPVINVTELEQVGMVVGDLTKSMEVMWNTFGIGPWDIYIFDAGSLSNVMYYGKPSRSGIKMARTHNKLGGVEIELVEPIGDDNIYRDFLREHGDGVQHLGWYKVGSLEALSKATQRLEEAGFPCIWSGCTYHSAFAYFDTTKALGTILELIWWDPTINARPSYTFPE